MGTWGLDRQIPTLELAVSELVTNALVHGTGVIEVELKTAGDVLRLDVADRGRHVEPLVSRPPPPGDRGGWGLALVEHLSDSWGSVTGPTGTRVWMETRIDPGSGGGDDRP